MERKRKRSSSKKREEDDNGLLHQRTVSKTYTETANMSSLAESNVVDENTTIATDSTAYDKLNNPDVSTGTENQSDRRVVTLRSQSKDRSVRHYSIIPVVCGRCDKEFCFADAILKNYIVEEVTTKSGPSSKTENDFVCGLCKMRINTRQEIKDHLIDHASSKEFLCEHCSSILNKRNSSITRKFSLDSDYDAACERPFKCGRCNIEKGDILVLKLTRTFSGSSKPSTSCNYCCSTCGKTTGTREEMCDHLTKHILSGEILCKECCEEVERKSVTQSN